MAGPEHHLYKTLPSKVVLPFLPLLALYGSSCHFMSLVILDVVRLFSHYQSGRCEITSHLALIFTSFTS